MANEMILLPKAKYESLLVNKCAKCDSETEVTVTPTSDDIPETREQHNSSSISTGLPSTFIHESRDADNGLTKPVQSGKQQQQQSSDSSGSSAGYDADREDTPVDSSSSDPNKLDVSNVEPVTNETLLIKFNAKDQKYVKNILEVSKKHPEEIFWEKDGVVTIKGNKLEGSSIYELLLDTVKDSNKNPVGKFLFYRSLASIGLSSKDIKNRTNKCFFNAVNGRKVSKECKKKIDGKKELNPLSKDIVKESSELKKSNSWISWN